MPQDRSQDMPDDTPEDGTRAPPRWRADVLSEPECCPHRREHRRAVWSDPDGHGAPREACARCGAAVRPGSRRSDPPPERDHWPPA